LIEAERLEGISHGIVGRTVREGTDAKFVVHEVRGDSPAAKQDVRPGDVLTNVGNRPVRSRLDFERALLGRSSGEELELAIVRGEARLTTTLALDSVVANDRSVGDRTWDVLGLRLSPLPTRNIRQV